MTGSNKKNTYIESVNSSYKTVLCPCTSGLCKWGILIFWEESYGIKNNWTSTVEDIDDKFVIDIPSLRNCLLIFWEKSYGVYENKNKWTSVVGVQVCYFK